MNENKLRLMMIYASVFPENFVGDRASQLMQVATPPPPSGVLNTIACYVVAGF